MIGRIFLSTLAVLGGLATAQDAAQPAPSPTAPTAPPPATPAVAPATAPEDPGDAPRVPKNKGDLITVTSSGGAEIHQKKNLMIYLQNVKFDHPTQNMVMKCERLEVYRDDPPPPPPKPPLAQEAAQGAKPEAPQQPDLKEAIATGNVVITKKGADGGNNVGRGQKAVFNGKTRDVLLSGNPSLEVGDNLFFADTIILREDGQHRLGNNARTVFKPKKNKEKGGAGGGAQP